MFDLNSEDPRAASNGTGGSEARPQHSPKSTSGSSQGKLSHSSRTNPCPICGRTKSGSCSIGSPLVFCHLGTSHHPPNWATTPGNHGRGHDGQEWAYLGETSDGRAGQFRLHQPKSNGSSSNGNSNGKAFSPIATAAPVPAPEEISLARLSDALAPDAEVVRPYYDYAPGQRIKREQKPDGRKTFRPQHLVGGEWESKAGPDPWPVFAQEQALASVQRTPGAYLLEVEGEKCALICHQAGFAAISQPGHAHKVEQIEPRYKELKEADCGGVIFLADNDETGKSRARQSADAAALASLPFLVLHASDVWAGLPQGGSIDDAPGTPSERALAVEKAIQEGLAQAIAVGTPAVEEEGDSEDQELAFQRAAEYAANIGATIDLTTVLPPRLAQRMIDRAEAFPIHPVTLLGPLLATVASVVGTRARTRVKEGWEEPFVIWVGTLLPPGGLKSPVSNVFGRPLLDLQSAGFENHAASLKQCGDDEAAKAEVLPPRRWVFSDATYERLVQALAQDNTVGVLSFQDELSHWFAMLDSKTSAQARAGWLSLWNGGTALVDRKTAESSFSRDTAVSLYGGVQPEKLRSMVEAAGSDPTKAGDGLWARFLWTRPPSTPWQYTEHALCIHSYVTDLLCQLDLVPTGLRLQLSPQAIERARQWWDAWALQEISANPGEGAFLAKLRGYSVRIAGILHLLDCLEQGDGWPVTVEAGAMERALLLSLFFLGQFQAVQTDMGAGDLPEDVAKFLRKVQESGLQEVTVREVLRWRLWGREDKGSTEALALMRSVADRYGHGVVVQGKRKDSWVWRAEK